MRSGWRLWVGVLLVACPALATAQVVRPRNPFRPIVTPIHPGVNGAVRVTLPTRLDWGFVVSPGATPASLSMPEYSPTSQRYRLFVPDRPDRTQMVGLFVYLSSLDDPTELAGWDAVCRQEKVALAVPYSAGDGHAPAKRLRIMLDVLDDVRRRFPIDADRTYFAGSGAGAAVACAAAAGLPEVCGGVVAIGGAGPLRPEPWLRDRARERLSFALVSTEQHPSRAELDRGRGPALREAGIRSRVWVKPGATPLPSAPEVAELYAWLETGLEGRRRAGARFSTTRFGPTDAPTPEVWALSLVREARSRLETDDTRTSGVMLLDGVATRWPLLAASREAARLRKEFDAAAKEPADVLARRELSRHWAAEARVATAVFEAVPEREVFRRQEPARRALAAWDEVLRLGGDGPDAKEAGEQVVRLRKVAGR